MADQRQQDFSQQSSNDEVHRWLLNQQAFMETLLVELANINSGTSNFAGLHLVANRLEVAFQDLGPKCIRRSLPPTQIPEPTPRDRDVSGNTSEEVYLTAPALIWRQRPEANLQVLLAIHYDTVYGKSHPFQKCERIGSQRLRGPGVADAKGGIVALLYALKAVEQFGLAPDVGWTVVLNPDEEIGSPGTAALWAELAPSFDFGLLFEPSLPDGCLVSDRKGSGTWTIQMRGRAAHAGRDIQSGRNAIVHLAKLLVEIDRLQESMPGLTVNVGRINGGGVVNVVPDHAAASLNARFVDQTQVNWFEQQLREKIATYNSVEGYRCEVEGGVSSWPKPITPEIEQLMRAIDQLTTADGKLPKWRSTGGVCDGNKLAAAGLPNVDTLGPQGDGLHSDQEWVDLESLVASAWRTVRLLMGAQEGRWQLPSRFQRH